MKGVILGCLNELVEEEFGADKWETIRERAGLPKERCLPIADVDDAVVMKAVEETCGVLGITLEQAADAFGRHWACTYAPKLYGAYYTGIKSTKEFLLKLDDIHVATTRAMHNAHPPRFTYKDVDDRTLVMEYHSARGLMPFFIGLIRGVAEYYGERVDITPAGLNKVRVVFG